MMTGIHAKPSRGPDTAAGSSVGGGSDVSGGKKRPLESVTGSTASGLVEKKKKDKKKALKRL